MLIRVMFTTSPTLNVKVGPGEVTEVELFPNPYREEEISPEYKVTETLGLGVEPTPANTAAANKTNTPKAAKPLSKQFFAYFLRVFLIVQVHKQSKRNKFGAHKKTENPLLSHKVQKPYSDSYDDQKSQKENSNQTEIVVSALHRLVTARS